MREGVRAVPDCIFCRIAAGEVRAQVVYEDAEILAFRDINPQAPVHVLLIPREHIPSLDAVAERHAGLLGRLLLAARSLAAQLGLGEGYRVVNNCGARAGQSVFHLHFHLLGGRDFAWPPG